MSEAESCKSPLRAVDSLAAGSVIKAVSLAPFSSSGAAKREQFAQCAAPCQPPPILTRHPRFSCGSSSPSVGRTRLHEDASPRRVSFQPPFGLGPPLGCPELCSSDSLVIPEQPAPAEVEPQPSPGDGGSDVPARPLDSRYSCAAPERFEARANFSSSGVGPSPESSPASELLHPNPHSPNASSVQQCGDERASGKLEPSHVEKVETPFPETADPSRKLRGPDQAALQGPSSRDSAGPVPPDKHKPVPGSRASKVKPSELWSAWFGAVSSADCSLGIFFHSLRELPRGDRGPTAATRGGQRLWPMPLPYPSLLLPGCGERDPDQLALNAIVLVLDWLHLGQPSVCKAELGLSLGRPLNPRQWRALDLLRGSVQRWNRGAEVGPSEMGRAAAKFEGLEDLLEGAKRRADEFGFRELRRLGSAKLTTRLPCHALPVDASRLRFVERPSFDPLPYLDSPTRALYSRPLDYLRPEPVIFPLPRAQVRTVPGGRMDLLRALDSCGRLCLWPEDELASRGRNGLFAVAKDESRDRMVLDARGPNAWEGGADRWIQSLGSLEQICHMYIAPSHDVAVYAEDLREYYHAFVISAQRQQRNVLALSLTREELRSLSCCAKGPARHVMIPCLNTLAMGDTHAVNYGQTAHLSVVLRQGVLRLQDFVTLKGRPPRSPALTAGLLIDDMILLDPVERRNPASPPRGLTVMKQIREGYEASGLPRHCGKAVSGEWEAEFWGGLFDGKAGILRPNPKRVVPLGFFLVRLVRSGFVAAVSSRL